jgi:hypothetical protein
MNETMSLVLATAILAIGGVGLYMYKQSDDVKYDEDYNYDLDDDVDTDSDIDSYNSEDEDEYDKYSDDFVDYEPKVSKQKAKTKRNKTAGGTRKKRY